jgi:hypothetical protein
VSARVPINSAIAATGTARNVRNRVRTIKNPPASGANGLVKLTMKRLQMQP